MFNFKNVIILSIALFCFACNNDKSRTSVKVPVGDTVRSLAVFKSAASGIAEAGIIKKFYVADTLTWKMDGNDRQILTGGLDSFYLIAYSLPVSDSTGSYLKDSSGKTKTMQQEIPTDKKWVADGFQNLDSAIRYINALK